MATPRSRTGTSTLPSWSRHLKWRTLAKERRLLAANLGMSPKQVLRDYCIKPFCPTWVFSAWRRLHGRRSEAGILHSFLSDGFKQRQGFDERVRSLIHTRRSCLRTAREKHWEMIHFPLYQYALEVADKSSAAFQVEARYPFFDRRLIELCLSLPARLKLGQGWTRLILRRAMEGILPESVRWRPNKANLSPNFFYRLVDRDQQMLKSVILEDPSEIEPYLDIPVAAAGIPGLQPESDRAAGRFHDDIFSGEPGHLAQDRGSEAVVSSAPMMTSRTYCAYGLTVRSEIPLPELPEIAAAPADVDVVYGEDAEWTVKFHDRAEEIEIRADGARFWFAAVGGFAVQDGVRITAYPKAGVSDELLRLYVEGMLFAMLLHQRGMCVLHASVIEIEGEVVALMGHVGRR